MENTAKDKKPVDVPNRSDHMANERTFLAWVRTIIGIMAFGFVVEKFDLFLRKFSYLLEISNGHKVIPSFLGYSSLFGIILVGLGAVMGVLAFARYKKVEREINESNYRPSLILDILVGLVVVAIGIFLVFYMIHSLKNC